MQGLAVPFPIPGGIPHTLVSQDRAAFPQHIPYFPIYLAFCVDLWRQLHGLRPCPRPPRLQLYLFCHSYIYAFQPPLPERLLLFHEPTCFVLLTFEQTWLCLALWCCMEPNQVPHQPEGKVVYQTWDSRDWTLWLNCKCSYMHGQCSNVIFPLWLLFLRQSPKHIDQSGVESFTLTIGLQMIWAGPYLSHSHQVTEVSHQLTLKVTSLVC